MSVIFLSHFIPPSVAILHQINRMASAKKIRDEIMTMTIVVNSNPAQQEIYNLTKKNRELTQETQKLREERTKIAKTLGKESEEYKSLTKQINDNSSTITNNNRKIKELGDTLDISQMSVKQLKQELVLLRRELDRVVPGSDQYRALQERIGQVSTRLAEVRNGARDTSLSFGALADRFNQYSGIIAGIVAILVGFGLSVQAVIDRNNKMADAMSGVEKTTGMTRKEVEALAKTYADFDTRTKRIDLLKISEVGGRLGVAKNEISEFTQEVDKAYVALGDSWQGGVDKLADSLGRISTLYAETKDLPIAESINQIGSALNELAAKGASSEQNIADFVARLGSMPPELKPALNTLLGFGSAFEESNINSEIASSGLAKFIRVASTETAAFAKVMRLSQQEVKDLINSDSAEFFLKFAEGLRGLKGTDLSTVLDSLKLSDNEVQRVIGAASENTDRFRQSVALANEAVAEGTSLTNEFNKVNNNAAGIYEKVQKKMAEVFTSKTVANFINDSVRLFGQFIGVIEDGNGAMTFYREKLLLLVKVVTVAVVAYTGLNLITGVYNGLLKTTAERVLGLTIVEKARNLVTATANGLTTLYTASMYLLGAGYALVTRNTAQATFAMRGFSAAIAANPIGAAVTLITLLASAYFMLSDNADEAKKSIEDVTIAGRMNKAVVDAQADSVGEFKAKVDPLIRTLKDENSQLDQRKKAYNDLIKIAPEFKGTLDDEFRATNRLSSVYDSLIAKIKEAAKVRALQALLDEEYKKREKLQAQSEMIDETKSEIAPTTTATINGQKVEFKGKVSAESEGKLQLFNSLAEGFNEKLKESDANIDLITKKMAVATESGTKSNYDVPDPDGDKAAKDAEKARKEKEAADRKAQRLQEQHEREMNDVAKKGEASAQLARQIQLDIEDATIEAMKEGYDKEIDMINLQEQRKLAEIDKKKVGATEINILQKKIDTATKEDKAVYEALMKSWKENNDNLENLKLREQSVFAQKRKALQAKTEVEWLKEQDDAYTKEAALLERKKNEELASYENLAQLKEGLQGRISRKELRNITTWQEGKEALTKAYQKQEIDLHIKHLQDMMALYEGLDLSILNEDQKKKITEQIEFAKNEIAKLSAAKNDLKNGEDSKKKGLGSKNKLGNQGSTDILGMSIDDWETFFTNIDTGANKLGTISAAIGAVQSAFSQYYSFVQQKEQAQLTQVTNNAKRRENKLKQMLDNGQINQEQYEAAIQRLNQDTEMEKYKLEYDAAKRQRNYMIAQTQANTAMAIMNIWATANNPYVAAAMSIVVGALGLIQTANIAKQPLPEAPGFEDGFGMEYDMLRQQDGKRFNVVRKPLKSGPVYRPTHFIAGENNKMEMVIDNKTYRGFPASFRRALHNEIAYSQGAQGYERGSYPVLRDPNYSGGSDSVYAEALNNNTQALNEFKRTTIRAYVVKDMDSAKNTIEMIDEYNSYQNQAKKK